MGETKKCVFWAALFYLFFTSTSAWSRQSETTILLSCQKEGDFASIPKFLPPNLEMKKTFHKIVISLQEKIRINPISHELSLVPFFQLDQSAYVNILAGTSGGLVRKVKTESGSHIVLNLSTYGVFNYPNGMGDVSGAHVIGLYSRYSEQPMVVHLIQSDLKSGPLLEVHHPEDPAERYHCEQAEEWADIWNYARKSASQSEYFLPTLDGEELAERAHFDLAFACVSPDGQKVWVKHNADPKFPYFETRRTGFVVFDQENFPVHRYKNFKWGTDGVFHANNADSKVELSMISGLNPENKRFQFTETTPKGSNTYSCSQKWGAQAFRTFWKLD